MIKDLMWCELGVTVKPSCDIMSPMIDNSFNQLSEMLLETGQNYYGTIHACEPPSPKYHNCFVATFYSWLHFLAVSCSFLYFVSSKTNQFNYLIVIKT